MCELACTGRFGALAASERSLEDRGKVKMSTSNSLYESRNETRMSAKPLETASLAASPNAILPD